MWWGLHGDGYRKLNAETLAFMERHRLDWVSL
jgi:hypothetical protein